MGRSSYYWSRGEEKELIDLWNQGQRDPRILAARLGRKPEAVRKKLQRLGFVVGQKENVRTTTTEAETRVELNIPDELPSVEEALKLLAAAMDALSKPGLSKVDIQRLRSVVSAVKIYKELLADYMDYRRIEIRLVEMEEKFAQRAKDATKRAGT